LNGVGFCFQLQKYRIAFNLKRRPGVNFRAKCGIIPAFCPQGASRIIDDTSAQIWDDPVIDYLVKPVNIDELKQAVGRIIDKKQRSLDNPQLNNLLQLLRRRKDTGIKTRL